MTSDSTGEASEITRAELFFSGCARRKRLKNNCGAIAVRKKKTEKESKIDAI